MKKAILKMTMNATLSCSLFACSITNTPNMTSITGNVDLSKSDIAKKLDVLKLKEKGIIDNNSNKVFIADVGNGKKGASFSIKIGSSENTFSTKVNSNGQPQKTMADVDHYIVYLVSNVATPYPTTGDPLGADKVAGPFTISKTGLSQTVTFSNVPDSLGKYYYIAVRCQQVAPGNEDIVKRNLNWGATTQLLANGNGRVAVSNLGGDSNQGGVKVDVNLVVSSTISLDVKPDLENATAATLRADVTPQNGTGTIGAISAS